MIALSKFVALKDYNVFAGPGWPSYQDFINGVLPEDNHIQQEIAKFTAMMLQTYQEITLGGDVLAQQNQQRQGQVFFNKQLDTVAHCTVPWNTLGVNYGGDIFICSSPSWVPKFVGNLLKVNSVFDALNSEIAQKIRQEILQGRYFYCNNQICNFFKNIDPTIYQTQPIDTTPMELTASPLNEVQQIPQNLIFDFDYTCNFQCPSCRTELINNNKHHIIRPINNDISDRIKHMIIDKIQLQPVEIRWCGGEPFISEVYLDLLEYIAHSDKPNIQHIIQTNGSYLQKKSDLFKKLLPRLKELRVSFDAATADTYHKVRVNGQWHTLLENVRWAREIINTQKTRTKLSADFVVQADNYKEIPEFVDLCNSLGIKHINFQKMWNWGTWPTEIFNAKNIYNSTHPDYAELVAIFKKINRPIGF